MAATLAGPHADLPTPDVLATLADAEADEPARRATAFAVRERSVAEWQPPAAARRRRCWRTRGYGIGAQHAKAEGMTNL